MLILTKRKKKQWDGGAELMVMRLWQLQPLNFIVRGTSRWHESIADNDGTLKIMHVKILVVKSVEDRS
jgi:hypothetical protein